MLVGDKVPVFSFTATDGLNKQLTDYQGQWLVLYFYPKDATPGCTTEGQDFRNHYDQFRTLNAQVFGISRDSLQSHDKFKCNQQFPFALISDSDETLCQLFDVIKMKNMYGKQVLGIERSTFLIDPDGILRKEWRKVKVAGHVQAVLDELTSLQG